MEKKKFIQLLMMVLLLIISRNVDKNIQTYIKNYVPKYVSCFVNSNINGKLIIGIKDDGEYTGIPSINKITKKEILDKIMNLMNKYIKTKLSKDKFMDIFNISIDTLKYLSIIKVVFIILTH